MRARQRELDRIFVLPRLDQVLCISFCSSMPWCAYMTVLLQYGVHDVCLNPLVNNPFSCLWMGSVFHLRIETLFLSRVI